MSTTVRLSRGTHLTLTLTLSLFITSVRVYMLRCITVGMLQFSSQPSSLRYSTVAYTLQLGHKFSTDRSRSNWFLVQIYFWKTVENRVTTTPIILQVAVSTMTHLRGIISPCAMSQRRDLMCYTHSRVPLMCYTHSRVPLMCYTHSRVPAWFGWVNMSRQCIRYMWVATFLYSS